MSPIDSITKIDIKTIWAAERTPLLLINFLCFHSSTSSSLASDGGVLLSIPYVYSEMLIIIIMITRFKSFFSTTANQWHHTTILAIKKNQETVIVGDGQVSYGPTIVKTNSKKVRPLTGGTFCGFAGSVADAFALM